MEACRYPAKIAIGFQEGTCPLKCNKCFAFGKNGKKEVGKMSLQNAKGLIDEILEFETLPKIQPHIFTEPFANNDLKEIIVYCNERSKGKLGMSIITNGILVDDEWEKFILSELNENYTISFSLDAVTQNTYEKVRGNFNLADIENRIISILSKRKGKTPRISVNSVVEHENESEMKEFLEKWKYIVDAVRITVCLDDNRKIPIAYRSNIKNIYVPCSKMFDVMTIDYNGEVRCCQVDAFGDSCLGNVFTEGILNVWNGISMNNLRQKQNNNLLEKADFCYGCEFKYIEDLHEVYETEDFLIKKGSCAAFFNRK